MLHTTSQSNSNHKENLNNATSSEFSQIIKSLNPKHPALNRVRAKLLAVEKIETAITSYDRMHHRHNRS
ncbi:MULTISPECIES: YhhA family cyclophane-containing RiPP [Fischerella]|uniref:YhhA family cyclophane-containing RiPP n=1 Tax=Fischerella TaxID=1190 RepID=UPI0002F2F1A2|nr:MULTISPECIES: YhhA family cyclophane-containing RiPP [Fischerella]